MDKNNAVTEDDVSQHVEDKDHEVDVVEYPEDELLIIDLWKMDF